jgi:hypothetical protein
MGVFVLVELCESLRSCPPKVVMAALVSKPILSLLVPSVLPGGLSSGYICFPGVSSYEIEVKVINRFSTRSVTLYSDVVVFLGALM